MSLSMIAYLCSLYWKIYCCVRKKYHTRQTKCPFEKKRRRVKDRQARADDLLISYLQQGRCSQCLLSLSYETSHKNQAISLRPVFCVQRGLPCGSTTPTYDSHSACDVNGIRTKPVLGCLNGTAYSVLYLPYFEYKYKCVVSLNEKEDYIHQIRQTRIIQFQRNVKTVFISYLPIYTSSSPFIERLSMYFFTSSSNQSFE